jgi:hypothetical protein
VFVKSKGKLRLLIITLEINNCRTLDDLINLISDKIRSELSVSS